MSRKKAGRKRRQKPGRGSDIRISACVIVKDEARNLPRWLAGMRQIADEILVVDTGSTDRTVELARAAGATVYAYTWNENFAAARNFALSKATGNWVLFLDADEYFSADSLPLVRKAIRQARPNVLGFVCRVVNIDPGDGDRVLNDGMHIRVFRCLPQLRYVGRVHEELRYTGSIANPIMQHMDGVTIYHTGYAPAVQREKASRNLRLLQAKEREGKGEPSDAFYLADCYYALGDYQNAAEQARRAIALGTPLPGRETRPYAILLDAMNQMGEALSAIEQVVRAAERRYPYVPSFRAALGLYAYGRGERELARKNLQESLALYREFQAHRGGATAGFPDEMPAILPRIRRALDDLGQASGAEQTAGGAIHISAAVIVKNEEDHLPTWLACVQKLADEIVVVDTGSTDRTVEIAEQAGVVVRHFRWIDDFAAAKNFAIEQVHGRWVILMDADEYIPAEEYGHFRADIARYDAQENVLGFVSDWICIDPALDNQIVSSGQQIRVFKNLPELRYVRMIHERLNFTGPSGHRMVHSTFSILHTGYTAANMPEKFRRNERMLLASQKKYGAFPEDDMYLADCYYGMGEFEKSIACAKRYLESDGRVQGGENRPYAIWMQALLNLHRDTAEIEHIAARALAEFPWVAEFPIFAAHAHWRERDYLPAKRLYRQAAALYERPDYWEKCRSVLLDEEATPMMPSVYSRLAKLARWQGEGEMARFYVQKALSLYPRYREGTEELLHELEPLDDAACLDALRAVYDDEKDAAYLLDVMPQRFHPVVRLYYAQFDGNTPAEEALFLAGEKERAAKKLAIRLAALEADAVRATEQGSLHDPVLALLLP
ncbi:MAG: glycosyltransferase [Selenomonadaceae bacterium]|nr:glycosyltransferase [Selenomonadaceae bacterium]MDY2685104.1 glycosyltransferase [Selenomonadaceae bacterium]